MIGCGLTAIDAIVELMEPGATDTAPCRGACSQRAAGADASAAGGVCGGGAALVAGRDFIDAHQLVHAINAALARHYPGPELTVLSALGERRDCYRDLAESLDRARLPGAYLQLSEGDPPGGCAPPGSRWMPTTGRSSCAYNSPRCAIGNAMPIKNANKIVAALEKANAARLCGGLADISKERTGLSFGCHEARVHAQYYSTAPSPSPSTAAQPSEPATAARRAGEENLFGAKCNPHTLKIADRTRPRAASLPVAPAKGDLTPRRWSPSRDISKIVFNNPIFNAKKAEA
ncbi:hypothetical protein M8494_28580 [Serratia ureilytica]